MRFPILTVTVCLLAAPALAGGSAQHSAQSAGHSAQASAHGSAAVVTGAGEILAVPLIITGRTLQISGAALADVGHAAQSTAKPKPRANGKPKLN